MIYHNSPRCQEAEGKSEGMDECGVERIVNITMSVGEEALEVYGIASERGLPMFRYHRWMELERSDQKPGCARAVERLERSGFATGACAESSLGRIWPNPS